MIDRRSKRNKEVEAKRLTLIDEELREVLNHSHEVLGRVSACDKCPRKCLGTSRLGCSQPMFRLLVRNPSAFLQLVIIVLLGVVIALIVS